jgi:hypothetical protein
VIYIYSTYDLQTGRITGFGAVSDLNLVPHKEGKSTIEGYYDKEVFMVVDDKVVEIPQKTIEAEQIALAWNTLKGDRDRLLARTDWTQVPDAPVDHAAWAVYRQQLRDLPKNTTDPRHPVWPTPPG